MTLLGPERGTGDRPAVDQAAPAGPGLVPRDRRYRALPGRRQPLLVVEHARPAFTYAREHLLAPPPGPPWQAHAHRAVIAALRLPALWRLLPDIAAPDPGPRLPRMLHETVAGWHVVVLRHSRDVDASTVVALVPPEPGCPGLVAKVATSPPARARLAAEADRLRRLGITSLGESTRATVPELVDLVDDGRRLALITTGCPGTSMLVRFHRRCGQRGMPATVAEELWAAGRWLETFQRDTARGHGPLTDAGDLTLEARLVTGAAADDPVFRAALAGLAAARARLAGLTARRCAVHGDFWIGNILTDGAGVSGVLDWERFRTAGEPTADLARLVLAGASYLDRHTRPGRPVRGLPGLRARGLVDNLTYTLEGTGWFPDLTRGFLGHHLDRLELPHDAIPDLLALEAARIASESTDTAFARAHLQLLHRLTGPRR